MTKQLAALLVLLSLGGAAAALIAYRHEPSRAQPEHARDGSSGADVNELKAEVTALRQELRNNASGVRELRAETGSLTQAVAIASARAEQTPDTEPHARLSRDSPERAAWEASRQALLATTEADFQAEPRNAAWSTSATTNIKNAAAKHGTFGESLRAIECRSKTCRVEIPAERARGLDMSRFLTDCGASFPKMISQQITGPDQKTVSVVYMMSGA